MALNLKEMRQRVKEKNKGFTLDNTIFPFFKIGIGGSAVLRFIPYEDSLSGGYWTEKKMVPMTFVDNKDETKTINFKAPSLEMYISEKGKCPLLNKVRPIYKEIDALKDAGNESEMKRLQKIAGNHWMDLTVYYQGFVESADLIEESVPENPIRIFPIIKSIHTFMYNSVTDEKDPFEFGDVIPAGSFDPADIPALLSGDLSDADAEAILAKTEGYNFIINKTKKGEFANYDTSTWARKSSLLSDEQLAAIAQYGVHDLRKRLPEQPTEEQYAVLEEMMDVSLAYAFGEGDGLWNEAWEEAGFKPFRGKSEKSDESADGEKSTTVGKSSGGSVADRVKRNLGKTDDKPAAASTGTSGASIRDRLKASRGATTTVAAAETPVADEAPETVDTPVEEATPEVVQEEAAPAPVVAATTKPASSAAASLAARVKAATQKNKTA